VKADGRREEFQREKLLAGVLKACAKRPIPTEVIEGLVGEIEGELYRRGEREVEAGDFFLGPGKTAMQPGELMTAIRFPVPLASAAGRYLKLGRNRLGDLSIVGVAVFGFPDPATASASGWLL